MQKTVALSSAEAEYYTAASAVSEAVNIQQAVSFWSHRKVTLNLHRDSSAAQRIINRQGRGRVKHLQISTLFPQDMVKTGSITCSKVGTKDNTADIGTKPLSGSRIRRLLLHWLGFQSCETGTPVGREALQEHLQKQCAHTAINRVRALGKLH